MKRPRSMSWQTMPDQPDDRRREMPAKPSRTDGRLSLSRSIRNCQGAKQRPQQPSMSLSFVPDPTRSPFCVMITGASRLWPQAINKLLKSYLSLLAISSIINSCIESNDVDAHPRTRLPCQPLDVSKGPFSRLPSKSFTIHASKRTVYILAYFTLTSLLATRTVPPALGRSFTFLGTLHFNSVFISLTLTENNVSMSQCSTCEPGTNVVVR